MTASKSRRKRREEARRAGKLARAVEGVVGSPRCACGALAVKRGGPTQGFLCHNGHWFGAEELAKGGESGGLRLTAIDRLTRRERQALEGLGRGLSDKDLAAKLGCSEATLRGHIRNAMRALRAASRAHAAVLYERRH